MFENFGQAFASDTSLDLANVFLRLVLALALGILVALVHRFTRLRIGRQPDGALAVTLVMLCVLLALTTGVVGDNVARAFSIVGALSIVRFRTVVEDTRDTAFVVFAVVIGLAVGAGYLWLPLLEKAMGSSVSDRRPLVPLDEMPEPDVVAPMLTKGRGVLRQQPDRLVLSMAGTVGGPELLALLTVFGPVLSAEATRSWKWQADMLAQQIASHALAKIHAAIESFTRKQGKRPASLAELLTSGELASASTLLVPGDEFAEPVLHDGKEFGKSSFRYYRDGLEVSPQGEKVTVHLITIAALRWQRLCLARDGTRIDGYGDFAQKTIAEIEQGK